MIVLVVDDHAIVRSGLRLILSQVEPEASVHEAANATEALALLQRVEPDLCLLDLMMPGQGGLQLMPRLLEAAPRLRILVLSMNAERDFVCLALRGGAQGYLVKDCAVEELAEAIQALREGRSYLSRKVAAELLTDYARGAPAQPKGGAPSLMQLTARQRDVLQRLAEGLSTRQIAERLHLSVKTVGTHRAELMRRLAIHDIAGLTRFAIRQGLLTIDG